MSKPMSRYVFSSFRLVGGVRFSLARDRCEIWVRGLTGASPQAAGFASRWSMRCLEVNGSFREILSKPPFFSGPLISPLFQLDTAAPISPKNAQNRALRASSVPRVFRRQTFFQKLFFERQLFSQNFAPRRFFYPEFFQSIFLFLHEGFSMDFLPIFKIFFACGASSFRGFVLRICAPCSCAARGRSRWRTCSSRR